MLGTESKKASIGMRGVIGKFFNNLELSMGKSWVDDLSMKIESDQYKEEYRWLSASPAMREWLGGIHAKGLTVNGIDIENKEFETTLEFRSSDIRRDKTGQINARIADLSTRVAAHWCKLLSLLILNGTGDTYGLCYDGQCFFDDDHSEGNSGVQKNLLTSVEVGALDVTTPTSPTVAEAADAALGAINHMLTFVDDQAEPIHELAQEFAIMTGPSLGPRFSSAVTSKILGSGVDNHLAQQDEFKVRHITNPRLANWTTQFAVFRTDAHVQSFIRQVEDGPRVEIIGPGSDNEIMNGTQIFTVKLTGNCGYGRWQNACHCTLS